MTIQMTERKTYTHFDIMTTNALRAAAVKNHPWHKLQRIISLATRKTGDQDEGIGAKNGLTGKGK